MSRFVVAIALAVFASAGQAAPVKPVVPCDRPVHLFGGPTLAAEGVRVKGAHDFATRAEVFFNRVCSDPVKIELHIGPSGRLLDGAAEIADRLARAPRSIALLHFPLSDIENGASVEQLLNAYRKILDACAASGATCIVGGQQPVNSFSKQLSERQSEVERRASAAFGSSYLPLYHYFAAEWSGHRLALPFDSGDGRHISDLGHELLFAVYRLRLLELTGDGR